MTWYNESEGDVASFLEGCDSLLELLDTLPSAAAEFAESVGEKVDSMRAWAEDNGTTTARMVTALENMREGAERWIE